MKARWIALGVITVLWLGAVTAQVLPLRAGMGGVPGRGVRPAGASATPTTTSTATPTGTPQPLLRAAFYYPWFPQSWTQRGIFPYTYYRPTLGFYDSSNPVVIQQHIAAMQYGHIDAGIASWWGPGSSTDGRIAALLQGAQGTTFRWSLYYEAEGYGDPTVSQIQADLVYLRDRYSTDPAYLHLDGRFVVFVYGGGEIGCNMADRWKQANTVGAYIVLKVFSGYQSCASQPDGWHQYNPGHATDEQRGFSYGISPGFWHVGETPRLERDLARWRQNIRDMIASGEPLQLVETFNEWGEGTGVESADTWSSASGYGAYLDALHDNGGSPLTPTPTAEPALVGHVTWEGRGSQPDALQQLPLTLTLRLGAAVYTYPFRTTDARGVLTIPVGTLPAGVYAWWAKGSQSLANTGTVTLTGGPTIPLEIGLLRTGDVNNDNIVDVSDFSLLRSSFGIACGSSGYNGRAELNGDCVVDITDFSLLRSNFGQAGAPLPTAPASRRGP